ncbi:hypothetical protein Acr_11g0014280 [Actinidia rufa]|uniref:CCHC-type domain-containing protein n=1 Tax=Actinidia rufa TaxID=165716 RepID=A0A7J0FEJ0_9ERIC|nr:hypothetical protein Acr_11g0014280 [Actinidia rufa]
MAAEWPVSGGRRRRFLLAVEWRWLLRTEGARDNTRQQRQPHPNPVFVEEEEAADDEEVGSPFARDLPQGRGRRPIEIGSRRWELERQSKWHSDNFAWADNSYGSRSAAPVIRSNKGVIGVPGQTETTNKAPTTTPNRNNASGEMRCFKCGESGHCATYYWQREHSAKGLFIEGEEIADDGVDELLQDSSLDLAFDGVVQEEQVGGDDGHLLMVCWACFTPREIEGDG